VSPCALVADKVFGFRGGEESTRRERSGSVAGLSQATRRSGSPKPDALGRDTLRVGERTVESCRVPFGSTSRRRLSLSPCESPTHESMQAPVATRARIAAPTRRTDATALRDFHCFQPNGGAPPPHPYLDSATGQLMQPSIACTQRSGASAIPNRASRPSAVSPARNPRQTWAGALPGSGDRSAVPGLTA
jgi:hypothetical protein